MKQLLEYITRGIADNQDVKIEKTSSGDLIIYVIKAPKEVMGMLIGKNGNTIRAIRALARARAIIDQEAVAVRLEEIS